MKVYSKCGLELPEINFYKDPRRENGLRSVCKKCWAIRKKQYRITHEAEIKASDRRYYENNKYKLLAKSKRWQLEHRELLSKRGREAREPIKRYIESKKTPCVKCGESRLYLVQFHHVDPSTKKFNINASNAFRQAIEVIDDEIMKCVCLCPTCHVDFHYKYGYRGTDLKKYLEDFLKE